MYLILINVILCTLKQITKCCINLLNEKINHFPIDCAKIVVKLATAVVRNVLQLRRPEFSKLNHITCSRTSELCRLLTQYIRSLILVIRILSHSIASRWDVCVGDTMQYLHMLTQTSTPEADIQTYR